ncbi:MAG: hypothetical protein ACKO9H_04490, partial [Planctomycetota bacterium]
MDKFGDPIMKLNWMVCLALFAGGVWAQPNSVLLAQADAGGKATVERKAPEKVTTVEGVTEYRLGNGARVLLFPENSRPTITVNMT